MSSHLSLRNAYGVMAKQSREYGELVETKQRYVRSHIEKATAQERKNVEKALQAYHAKVDTVLKEKSMVESTQAIESYSQKRRALFEKVIKAFLEERQRLTDDTTLSFKEKQTRIHDMFTYFQQHFLTTDEKKMFDDAVHSIIVLPGGPHGFPTSSSLL